MLCDGFGKYPSNPAKALPNDPPGAGGTVTIFSDAALPLPTPLEQNPAWQAVNKALNANVQFNIIAIPDYPGKLAALMAGGDLPDIISFITIASLPTAVSFVPGGQQFLQAQAADLTPFLAGDAAPAVDYIKKAFALFLEIGNDADAAQAVSSLAQIHLRLGAPILAEEQARHALAILYGRDDYREERGNAHLVLGRALLGQEAPKAALAEFATAERMFLRLGSKSHLAAAWTAEGDAYAELGDTEAAAALYRRAASARVLARICRSQAAFSASVSPRNWSFLAWALSRVSWTMSDGSSLRRSRGSIWTDGIASRADARMNAFLKLGWAMLSWAQTKRVPS